VVWLWRAGAGTRAVERLAMADDCCSLASDGSGRSSSFVVWNGNWFFKLGLCE
jgi:hypothetical protein